MAVHNNGNNQNNGQTSNSANAMASALGAAGFGNQNQNNGQAFEQANYNNNGRKPDKDGSFSWFNLGALGRGHVGISPNGEALNYIKKAMLEYWDKTFSGEVQLQLIALDKDAVGDLSVSLLIVALKDEEATGARVAYRAGLVARSVDDLQPKRETINGIPIDVTTVLGEAYDEYMVHVIHKAIEQAFPGVKPEDMYDAGAFIIPRTFEVENDLRLHLLTVEFYQPCRNLLDSTSVNAVPFNVVKARNDSTLSLRIKTHNPHDFNFAGEPVRSDVTIELNSMAFQNNKIYPTKSQPVTRVSGYVDLLWNQTNPANGNPFMPQMPQFQMGPSYHANFIITDLRAFEFQTLGTTLLALATAAYACKDNNWAAALYPMDQGNGTYPLHDIGAINYELQIGGKVERIITTPDQFDRNLLGALIHAHFHPGVVLSIDVPRVGTSSWMTNVFVDAALGNIDARNLIRHELNVLTNGNFDKLYKGDGSFFQSNGNIITNGYYTDNTGVQRDIRDIDYLAVLGETGEKDPDVIRNWSDSYNQIDSAPEYRDAVRVNIQQALRPSFVPVSKSDRLNVEPAFMEALLGSLAACGFNAVVAFDSTQVGTARANASYVNNVIMSNVNSNIFRAGVASHMQQQAHNQYNHYNQVMQGQGRWTRNY